MVRMARIGLVGLALLIGAWFALGWVQARDTGRADALLLASSSPSRAQAAQIRSLLASAGSLNPDRTVDLLRARLAVDENNYPAAVRILEAVTRSEPENVFAWSQLGYTAGAVRQFSVAEAAARHVAQLDPNPGR